MLEGGFRVVGSVRFLSSMVFSNSPNGAFTSPVAFWSSADDVHRIAIVVTAMAGLALAASLVYTRRGSLKSPWSHRRRKHALSPQEWRSLFTSDGKLQDGGVKFLKKVRSGGVDPSIRAKVWPFLLGFYDLNSSEEERNAIRTHKRKEYENLRRRCHWLLQQCESFKKSEEVGGSGNTEIYSFNEESDSLDSEGGVGANQSLSAEEAITDHDESNRLLDKEASEKSVEEENSDISNINVSAVYTESSGGESSVEESESTQMLHDADVHGKNGPNCTKTNPVNDEGSKVQMAEDFSTWQRIIHLDAVRANDEWIDYSPNQASVSEGQAQRLANSVRLKDYNHLEPCRVFHAARLVAILEAYSLYDPEIGYCQGMSDLLAPIITVIEEDFEAFWCFVGFMRKARHNFRLDEVGIRRQLSLVSKIIKSKDSHLYNHLEKLQAEDCFFVYRMVVVLFRRELTFEQTLCLWEVMWADQAAIRAGIGKSAWGRMRLRVPPTEDLLLYAIAACVLKKRKLIIEKYSSMEEIMRECNDMAGQLDVWKLLDDAYDLVVTLHDKV